MCTLSCMRKSPSCKPIFDKTAHSIALVFLFSDHIWVACRGDREERDCGQDDLVRGVVFFYFFFIFLFLTCG